jgi:hypothetical protein
MNVTNILAAIAAGPLPWVVAAGVFLGAAVSRATRRLRPGRDPERERSRRLVGACLLASIAVVLGLCAVFLPGPSKIADPRLAWAAAGGAVLSFVAFRFRRALGIPVLVLLVALGVAAGLFFRSITAFTGETVIGQVRVISAADAAMRLELVPRGAPPVVLEMKGEYFAPIVKVVIFDDLAVFLGATTWYRFEGLTSFDAALRQQDTDYRFTTAPGLSGELWSFFEANETRIPGVKTVQVEMNAKRAKALATYDLKVQNDGGVEIVPRS